MPRCRMSVLAVAASMLTVGCNVPSANRPVAVDDTPELKAYAKTVNASVSDWTEGRLNLYMPAETTDEVLVTLGKLAPRRLGALNLRECVKVTDAGFSALASLPGLGSMTLPPQFTDAAFVDAAKRFPKLEYLEIECSPAKPSPLTSAGLKSIAGVRSLLEFNALFTVADDSSWADFAKVPRLHSLRLGSPKLTGVGVKQLANTEKVWALAIANSPLTAASMNELGSVDSLKSLSIADCGVTDARLAAFNAPEGLTYLILEANPLTDEGMNSVARMKNLKVVGVIDSPISDAGLMHLSAMKSATNINFERSKVTEAGVAAFNRVRPAVKVNKN